MDYTTSLRDELQGIVSRLTRLMENSEPKQCAAQDDRLGPDTASADDAISAFRFDNDVADNELAQLRSATGALVRTLRPPLPDPRLIRRIILQRQMRAQFLGSGLFADPAWDMLLDLTAAREEHRRVSVTSLCIASRVPPTTALRWITLLEEAGLVQRSGDNADRRRTFIALTDKAASKIARYFDALQYEASRLV